MKILFHCWEYPPHSGGVGRYIQNMSQALAAAGHLAVIAAGKAEGMPEYTEENNVIIHRCFSKEDIYARRTAERVLTLTKKYAVDLIEGADHLGCSSSLLFCTNRPPVVIKCHSCSILHAANEKAHVIYSWQKWAIRLARLRAWRQTRHEKRSIEQADVLTAPSGKIFEEMITQGIQLPERRMVIPNPISAVESTVLAESARPTILFVGRLDIGKGIQYLPGLLRSVSQQIPDVRLEIAGADSYARGLGSLREWLRKGFGDYEKQVDWLGYLTEQGVQQALQRAWVVIVPSRWDTFPTVLLETMAHGKAAVVSDQGGIPEMTAGCDIPVCSPDSGAFADNVTELLRHADKRKQVGASGYNKVLKDYSPRTITTKYKEMAEKVLGAC
ncbi:MAG: glycosyltransferase family 1 protein [Candidatus Electrothrix sp. AUS1_2]|nr:glycosyltransferase family 1 protein [Candidatus Electrothrix sp. AUS1_2]